MSKIFISYRSNDTAALAVHLYEKLAARFGPEAVFRDDASTPAGIDYRDFLWSHLKLSVVMLVLIGPHWFAAGPSGGPKLFEPHDFVRDEIAEALRRNIRVVTILAGGQRRLREEDLPDPIKDLAHRQYRYIRDRDAVRDMESLIVDLEKMGIAPVEPPRTESSSSPSRTITVGDVKPENSALTFGDGSPATVINHELGPR